MTADTHILIKQYLPLAACVAGFLAAFIVQNFRAHPVNECSGVKKPEAMQ